MERHWTEWARFPLESMGIIWNTKKKIYQQKKSCLLMIQTEQFTFPCVVEAAMANLWSVSLLKKNTDESVKKRRGKKLKLSYSGTGYGHLNVVLHSIDIYVCLCFTGPGIFIQRQRSGISQLGIEPGLTGDAYHCSTSEHMGPKTPFLLRPC